MKNLLAKFLVLFLSIALVGCTNTTNKQGAGTVGGAVVGGLVGGAVGGSAVAVVGGAVVGALIGGVIGKSMDDNDRAQVGRALNTPPGRTTHWVNPRTGATYTVTTRRATIHGNTHCRRYRTIMMMNGKTTVNYGSVCLAADGKWHAVSYR